MPRSSRRPAASAERPPADRSAGVPQGAPYRPQNPAKPGAAPSASDTGVSDAEFRPVPPSSRGGGPSDSAPRDNSSRFDD
jgi:hypothetical protein